MTTFELQRCARRKCQTPFIAFLGETQGSVSLDNRGGMVLYIIENTCSLVASYLSVSVLRAGVTFTFFHLTLYYFTWHSIEHLGYLVRMFRRWLMQGRFDGPLWRALASQFHFKGHTYSLFVLPMRYSIPSHRPFDQADGAYTEVSSKTMASQFEEFRSIHSCMYPPSLIKNIHRLGEAYSEAGNYESSSSVCILDKTVSHCPYTIYVFGKGLLPCHR